MLWLGEQGRGAVTSDCALGITAIREPMLKWFACPQHGPSLELSCRARESVELEERLQSLEQQVASKARQWQSRIA
jgi:hypothetical protein